MKACKAQHGGSYLGLNFHCNLASLLEGSHVKWYTDSQAAAKVVEVGSMKFDLHRIARSIFPGEVLPYKDYMVMCRCEGYGFQAVYSRIEYINPSVWV